MSDEAIKKDTGKSRFDLISGPALHGLGDVLAFGAEKYAADNWRLGMSWRRVIASAGRHWVDFSAGVNVDPESGLPVIDHLGCCWMFLSEYQKLGLGADDRHKYATISTPVRQPDGDALLTKLRQRLAMAGPSISDEFSLVNKGELRQLLALFDR